MNPYRLTEHAQRRRQQRGISDLQMLLLHYFGEDHYQKGGASICCISERQVQLLRKALDGLSSIQLVKSQSESVITAQHATRQVRTTDFVA